MGRFPRSARLNGKRDFDRVFAQPRRQSDRYFTILYRSSEPDEPPRLGFAVSKRIEKRAVGRNRIKRLIRETFRLHQDNLGSFDVVVLPKPAAAKADNAQLIQSLHDAWARISKRGQSSQRS